MPRIVSGCQRGRKKPGGPRLAPSWAGGKLVSGRARELEPQKGHAHIVGGFRLGSDSQGMLADRGHCTTR